jgi:hypothetical protein
MLNLIFIYIVLLFLVMRFSVTVFNFLSNPKLGNYGRHYTDKVSIIVDTDDETGLLQTLNTLQQQDYQHIAVLIRKRKNSGLGPAIAAICKNDLRFQVKRGAINALEDTDGKYLLFLGANTLVNNGLINSLIYRTKVFNLGLLSIFPTQTITGFVNHCLVPLHSFVMLNLVPLRLVRLFSSPVFSAASSQCVFFDAGVYKKYDWHARLNGNLPEALEIVKAVKANGFKVETLLANRLLYLVTPDIEQKRFFKTGEQLLKGFGNNIYAALLYLFLVVAGPIVMLLNYEYQLLILPVGLIFLSRIMISFLSRQNPFWNVMLHPIQLLLLLGSLLTAVYTKLFTSSQK